MLWRYTGTFDADQRRRAGDGAYVMVHDTTCRLFGYHGSFDVEWRTTEPDAIPADVKPVREEPRE